MDYVSSANQSRLDQTYRATAFIVAFFAVTPLLLIFVGKLFIKETSDGDLATYQKIAKLLYGGTIALGLIVVALRRFGFSFVLRRQAGATAARVLQKLQGLTLVTAAIGELIGFLGFMAFLITRDYQFCWRLGVVSLAIILYSFPRRSEWARALAAAE